MCNFRHFLIFCVLILPLSAYSNTLESSLNKNHTVEKSIDFTMQDSEIANIEEEYSIFLASSLIKSMEKSTPSKGTLAKKTLMKRTLTKKVLVRSFPVKSTKIVSNSSSDYWKTVHAVESRQGLLLYRPSNKSRNCNRTRGACGHHQLTVNALKDIGCHSKQCKIDREDYSKSLQMSKKLLQLNEKRLLAGGYGDLPEYQKYLIHQQGAAGIKAIISAYKGTRTLSNKIKRNMANNCPYSYKTLKNMGSKRAANLFMNYWKNKWQKEKRLVSLDRKKQTKAKKQILLTSYNFHSVLNMNF